MQLVNWNGTMHGRAEASAAISGTGWREAFEQSAEASSWLAAHRRIVDLRTMEVVAAEIRERLQISPSDRVLEVGCGTGALLAMIVHPDQQAVGFDLCEALVRRGVRRELEHTRIHCGAADGEQLPLSNESFEKVICYGVMQCLSDEAAAMRVVRELVRVCKPGGMVFIGDVSGVLEKHRKVLSRIGMGDRAIETLLGGATPFWRLRRHWRHETPSHLFVRRSLFRKAIEGMPCDVTFRTFGVRPNSRCRFDVCIHKDDSEISGRSAVMVMPREPELVREPIQVERFDTFDQLLPLREKWDALAESVGADLFASFDWCSTWWKHFGQDRTAEIYVAWAGDKVVACLPFFRESIGYGPWQITVVRLIGSCDAGTRCDLAIKPAYIDSVIREVTRRLDQFGTWDVMHIGDLPGDFLHGRAVVHALQRGLGRGRVIYRTGYYPNSVFDIPESFDEYLMSLSSNERSAIRRTARRLAEDHQAQVIGTSAGDLDAAFDQFHRQHEEWWTKSGHLGYFRDWSGSLAFHRDFSAAQARTGRLYMLRLQARGESIGFQYSHRFGRHIHWFSGSRAADAKWDAYSPGRQLHCAIVREAIAAGATQIDGMNGYYEFKTRWGARYTLLQNITVMSQDVLSRIAVRDFTSASRLHFFYNRIWFWHMAPWLRKHFPKSKGTWLCQGQTKKFVRSRFMEYASAMQADDAICFTTA